MNSYNSYISKWDRGMFFLENSAYILVIEEQQRN